MDFVKTLKENKVKASMALVPVAVAVAPALAFAEETGGSSANVNSAITGMATTVANDGIAMINAVLPVLAPIIAAVSIATLGVKFVRRFSK